MRNQAWTVLRAAVLPIPVGIAVATVMSVYSAPRGAQTERLGDYLQASRKAAGFTLRAVEAETKISNGYLSQIESNKVESPSPNMLHKLATTYGIDYTDLLVRAGHRIPTSSPGYDRDRKFAGIPLRALEELTDDEAAELRNYLAFLRQKRRDRASS